MRWAALLLPLGPDATPPPSEALQGLACWALQFTPRVATVHEAIVMELEASLRLFGGQRALRDRVAAVPSVRKIDVRSLSRQEATIELKYVGGLDQLKASLAEIKLGLEGGDPTWRIARSEEPAAMSGQK